MENLDEKRSSNEGKDCNMCITDDDKMDVSVSPRRFSLPPPKEKKAKMEIKNKNSYPIYYKAGTSNMDAFTAHPNTGRIPPNSKVSVIVQFFDSARPIRRHEEVVVLTSIRPFDLLIDGKICPYCLEPLGFSKHHHATKRIYSADSTEEQEAYDFWERNAKQRAVFDKKDSRSSCEEVFQRKYSIPKREQQWATNYARTHAEDRDFKRRYSDETVFDKKEHHTRKEAHTTGTEELEEICLHAFVHRVTSEKCDCNNCVEFGTQTKGHRIAQPSFELGFPVKDEKIGQPLKKPRESKSEEHTTTEFQKETKKEKDVYTKKEDHTKKEKDVYTKKEDHTKKEKDVYMKKEDHTKKERDVPTTSKQIGAKEKTAHIIARVVKSEESKDSSDTETIVSSLDDKLPKMRKTPKIISEEDFKMRVQKAKAKKLQKVKEEESQSSSSTIEAIVSQEAVEQLPERKLKRTEKWTLMAIDSKCTTLLTLTGTTIFLLLLLMIMVISFIIFYPKQTMTITEKSDGYGIPCFYNFFR